MLGATKLDNIRQQAEVLGLPKRGPYYPYIDADLIAKLLTSRGLVGTVWKESKEFKDLPDVAIAMVDYDADWEVGRCVLYHRLPSEHSSKVAAAYVIDPYQIAIATTHPLRRVGFDRLSQPHAGSACGPAVTTADALALPAMQPVPKASSRISPRCQDAAP